MKTFIALAKEVWFCPFGKVPYLVYHILICLCCSITGITGYLADTLYFPWLDLRLDAPEFAALVIFLVICWMAFAGTVPVTANRVHTGQLLVSACFGFSCCFTLKLMQHRPLWVLLLLAAALFAGRKISPLEYANLPDGGHKQTAALKMHTLMRRANIVVVCMCLSWFLLGVSRLLPVAAETSVLRAVGGNSLSITDESWQGMDEGERFQTVQLVLQKECQEAGIPRPDLTVGHLPERTLAAFYREDRSIMLNKDLLGENSVHTCVYVMLHEFRHCWQYDLSMEDPKKLDDEQALMAEVFRKNLTDYLTSSKDGYDAYHDQPVEADARTYAAGRMEHYFPLKAQY